MGTFGGHAVPGICFILIAMWHIISIYKRYYKCRKENSKFMSSVWFPCTSSCLCGKCESWPIEPVIKCVLIAIAMAIEIYTGYSHGVFGNKQHVVMYFFFGFASFIDILIYLKVDLPARLDYALIFLANGIEFILFHFHLHGRSSLDVLLHTMLLYILVTLAVCIALEMKYQNNLLIALTNRFVMLLQGTWFWQIGSVLYKPFFEEWNQEDHEEMKLIPVYFGVHVGVNLIIVLLLGIVISCWSNTRQNQCAYHEVKCQEKLINTNSNEGCVDYELNDESEEDVEFQKAY